LYNALQACLGRDGPVDFGPRRSRKSRVFPFNRGNPRWKRHLLQCSKNRKCDRSLQRAAYVATTLTLAINRSAAAVGARATECGAGQGLAASTVGEAAFAVSTTRALNCVAATIAGLAATLPEFDTGFGRADRTDVRNAHFACAGTEPTIDLSATAVVDTTASSSRTDLWGAGLADIGDAKKFRSTGTVVIATSELAASAVVDGPAV